MRGHESPAPVTAWLPAGHRNMFTALTVCARELICLVLLSAQPSATVLGWNLAQVSKLLVPASKKPERANMSDRQLPRGARVRLGSAYFQTLSGTRSIILSPNGKTVAIKRRENDGYSLQMWDVQTGELLWNLSRSEIDCVAYSPDGKILAGVAGKEVVLWDLASGDRTQHFVAHPNHVSSLAFAPNGKILATGGGHYGEVKDTPIVLWDARSAQQIGQLSGPKTDVDRLVFSEDGQWLACRTTERNLAKGEIFIWDMKRSILARRLPLTDNSEDVLVDGRTLATFENQTIYLRDLVNAQTRFRLTGAFSSWLVSGNTKLIATIGKDNALRLWDVPSSRERLHLQLLSNSRLWCFSGDCTTLAVIHDNSVRFWNTLTGAEIGPSYGHRGSVTSLAFGPSGKWVASASTDLTVRLWETETGKQSRVLRGHNAVITRILGSPDGKLVASGDVEGVVYLWEAETGRQLFHAAKPAGNRDGHYAAIMGLSFTEDGKSLIAGSTDGTIRFLVTASGMESRCFKTPKEDLYALALAPGGNVLACEGRALYEKGIICLLDVNSGREVQSRAPISLKREIGSFVMWGIHFSPDGKVMATSDSRVDKFHGHLYGHSVRLWETATGREIVAMETAGWTGAMAFSHDGKSLAFGDGGPFTRRQESIRLWDLSVGREVGRLSGHLGRVSALEFSSDGTALASGGADDMVLLWDTSRPALKRQRWRTEELEKLDELWANLASADAAVAYKAIGRLSKAPAQAVPFLAKRLQPISVKDWRQIQQWIADLDDDRFAVRAKGSQELEKIGGLAEPRLSQALAKQPSMEMRHRILALQEKTTPARAARPAFARITGGDRAGMDRNS